MIRRSADGGTNPDPTAPRISVVIAAYDERENIELLTRRLEKAVGGLGAWELLYIIEGKDGTLAIAQRLAHEIPNIRILYEKEPRGLGRAFRRGFAVVSPTSDYIITMDADLNHQPEEIPRLLRALEDRRADILVGSRFVSGGRAEGTPVWKLALSGTFNIILRILFGLRTKDKTSGFRIYRAAALRALTFENDNFAFLPELLIKARASGLRIVEEPIHFIFRQHGTSKMHLLTTTFSYLSLLRLRFRGRGTPRTVTLDGVGGHQVSRIDVDLDPPDPESIDHSRKALPEAVSAQRPHPGGEITCADHSGLGKDLQDSESRPL